MERKRAYKRSCMCRRAGWDAKSMERKRAYKRSCMCRRARLRFRRGNLPDAAAMSRNANGNGLYPGRHRDAGRIDAGGWPAAHESALNPIGILPVYAAWPTLRSQGHVFSPCARARSAGQGVQKNDRICQFGIIYARARSAGQGVQKNDRICQFGIICACAWPAGQGVQKNDRICQFRSIYARARSAGQGVFLHVPYCGKGGHGSGAIPLSVRRAFEMVDAGCRKRCFVLERRVSAALWIYLPAGGCGMGNDRIPLARAGRHLCRIAQVRTPVRGYVRCSRAGLRGGGREAYEGRRTFFGRHGCEQRCVDATPA